MFQLVKAAVAGLVLVEAGAAAGGEGMSAWDVATGLDGHFPALNKHTHKEALSQGTKRMHHAKIHHHKIAAVHHRQHRRASAHVTKHAAKRVRLTANKGHRNTARKHLSHHGRHHFAGTASAAPLSDNVAETEAPVEVSTEPVAELAPIVATVPAVHVAMQTKQQTARKSQTRDDAEGDKERETDDDAQDDDAKKVRYGPNDCVSTWRNSQGRCMMQTDCDEKDVQRYEFSVVCIDRAGAEVRHIFGEDSFDTRETFDTLLTCKECQGWPRLASTTAAPVQLHAKAEDVVKEDVASKVELSTAQAVDQLVGQVKELKEQLKVAANEVNVLNEKVGITSTKEEITPALSQSAAPTTTAPLTVVFQSQLKTANLDEATEAHTRKRSLRAKLKQQVTDEEEDSEENAESARNSETGSDDAGASDEKTDVSDDASEGEEVD